MTALVGDMLVVTATGLGRITKVGPGSSASHPAFAPDWCVKPAVIGKTVCEKPYGDCWCGLAHYPAHELAWLPVAAT